LNINSHPQNSALVYFNPGWSSPCLWQEGKRRANTKGLWIEFLAELFADRGDSVN
jgi:hypothetical protein